MTWVATAVAGSAILGAGASIYGAKKSANALENASDQSAAVQERIYQDQMRRNQPYQDAGYNALNAYMQGMGLPGVGKTSGGPSDPSTSFQFPQSGKASEWMVNEAYGLWGKKPPRDALEYYSDRERADQLYYDIVAPYMKQQKKSSAPQQTKSAPGAYGGFKASPGYRFRLNEGANALDRNMAARGLLNSGARGKAMTRYAQGVASDEYGNYMNRLASAAGMGQTAVQNSNSYAGSYGANAANSMMNSGMARASGYLGTSGAISSGVNNVLASMPYWNRGGA